MRGRKRRVDATVVETDVHHRADSTVLADAVRVLGRAAAERAVEVDGLQVEAVVEAHRRLRRRLRLAA
jgi:IS5 family transposase